MKIDEYILEKPIGKGSYGEVILTSKKDSDKKFATKKYEREQIEGTELMRYLKNEIMIIQDLDHPNIVKFEDLKKTKKHFYIIMEYCNGGELSDALKKYQEKHGKSFSEEIVQHLMRQIIEAFKYIHSFNIIHRDIKLDNILLNFETEEDKENLNMMKATAKIIDFGFSCKVGPSGLQYSILGSPINMDPIILKKYRTRKVHQLGYDIKADIWSLGTICYEMLIGKPAFNAKDMDELVSKIEEGTYIVPTTLSKEVVSFLNAMLQYNSSERLNSSQLTRHKFLTKNIKEFQPIDIKMVSKKIDKNGLNINIKKNKSIWAIFNADDEEKLTKISGNECMEGDEENDQKEENNINLNTQPLDKTISGPILPSEGIPGNPINRRIDGATQEKKDCFIF